MFNTGDLVRVTVHGDTEAEVKELLEDLGTSEDVNEYLTPIPVYAAKEEGREFGGIELVQEFIVATGAEISAEVIVASVRSFLRRRASRKEVEQKGAPAAATRISVNILDDGAIELDIDVEHSS